MISVISSHVVYYPYIEYHEPQISYHCFTYLTHLCLLCFTCWPTKTPKPLTSSAYFTSSLYVTPIYWPTWPLASMFHLFTHLTSGHYTYVTPTVLTHLNSGLYAMLHLLTLLTSDLWPLCYTYLLTGPLATIFYTYWPTWPLGSMLHLLTHLNSGLFVTPIDPPDLYTMLQPLTYLNSGLYVTPIDPPDLWPLCYTYLLTWTLASVRPIFIARSSRVNTSG